MSKVVSQRVFKERESSSAVHAEVVLDDGRRGRGMSGPLWGEGNKEEALSRAIIDANSKPVATK
jgi:hypothetical protein